MTDHMDSTRRNLGKLGAMARQTEDMERRILSIASKRLDSIRADLAGARAEASAGDDDAKSRYTDMVMECGRLEQVIATARAHLGAN